MNNKQNDIFFLYFGLVWTIEPEPDGLRNYQNYESTLDNVLTIEFYQIFTPFPFLINSYLEE